MLGFHKFYRGFGDGSGTVMRYGQLSWLKNRELKV